MGAKTITKVVKEQLEPSVAQTTDDSTSYIRFDKLEESHKAVTSGKEAVKVFLPWGAYCNQQCQKASVGRSS